MTRSLIIFTSRWEFLHKFPLISFLSPYSTLKSQFVVRFIWQKSRPKTVKSSSISVKASQKFVKVILHFTWRWALGTRLSASSFKRMKNVACKKFNICRLSIHSMPCRNTRRIRSSSKSDCWDYVSMGCRNVRMHDCIQKSLNVTREAQNLSRLDWLTRDLHFSSTFMACVLPLF